MNQEGIFLIAFGDKLASARKFDNELDAWNYIDSKPWELILIGAAIYTDKVNEFKNK